MTVQVPARVAKVNEVHPHTHSANRSKMHRMLRKAVVSRPQRIGHSEMEFQEAFFGKSLRMPFAFHSRDVHP